MHLWASHLVLFVFCQNAHSVGPLLMEIQKTSTHRISTIIHRRYADASHKLIRVYWVRAWPWPKKGALKPVFDVMHRWGEPG